MKSDLPSPESILEELADKAAAQIERLAPVAFESALGEMIRYHQFLLALNETRGPDGAAFSYAQVEGNAWSSPHQRWIGQYGRLFERAADHIPNDDRFFHSLAFIPNRLLSRKSSQFSPDIAKAILDLGPIMMHRLEGWVTKRTTVEVREGHSAQPRTVLAGTDFKAYLAILPNVVGAWESLLDHVYSIYDWREQSERTEAHSWSVFRDSWPFLWQHLSNTAHCLAIAVWNEDESAATLFQEALARWPRALDLRLGEPMLLQRDEFLFPSILNLNWVEAAAHLAALNYQHSPQPTAKQAFASVISKAHEDVLFLTAALLIYWSVNKKQVSDIGLRTARALFISRNDDGRVVADVSFKALFLGVVRLEIGDEGKKKSSYSSNLNRLVERMDNMTERRVVPGRIFTPSTLHGRDELLIAAAGILAVHAPAEGDGGTLNWVTNLIREEENLPGGDSLLRQLVHLLTRLEAYMDGIQPQLDQIAVHFAPEKNVQELPGRFREVSSSLRGAIEVARAQKLSSRPIDLNKLKQIQLAIEARLFNEPINVHCFRKIQGSRSQGSSIGELRTVSFHGISKARFVDPPMEYIPPTWDEMFVSGTHEQAGKHVWHSFLQRKRIEKFVSFAVEDEAFWNEIADLVSLVEPDPILLVSRAAEARTLRKLVYGTSANAQKTIVERNPSAFGRQGYIGTIKKVDVCSANIPPGRALLFSAKSLQGVEYAKIHEDAYVDVSYDAAKEVMIVGIKQYPKWSDTPIFEIQNPDVDEDGVLPEG